MHDDLTFYKIAGGSYYFECNDHDKVYNYIEHKELIPAVLQ